MNKQTLGLDEPALKRKQSELYRSRRNKREQKCIMRDDHFYDWIPRKITRVFQSLHTLLHIVSSNGSFARNYAEVFFI